MSVENPALPGTPDINFILGWVELKYAEDWPARENTTVRIEHFTQQQRVWLMRRWFKKGACWLCLQVSKTRDWLVFTGKVAYEHVGREGVTRKDLMDRACFVGKSADDVAQYIAGSNNAHSHRLSK
ncbi:MAG: hypothetical protein GY934_09700 [Gammaproteobacteria bacterium]|nr:hypothetical protein [Gammaproteobacteria bacterium]